MSSRLPGSGGRAILFTTVMGELYVNPYATQQMLDDAFFNVEEWLAGVLADLFGSAEGNAFIGGNGVKQPMVVLAGTITNEVDGTRAFGTLQYIASGASGAFASSNPTDCLVNAVAAMRPGYRWPGEAAWLMNPTTLGTLMTLKDSLGRPL